MHERDLTIEERWQRTQGLAMVLTITWQGRLLDTLHPMDFAGRLEVLREVAKHQIPGGDVTCAFARRVGAERPDEFVHRLQSAGVSDAEQREVENLRRQIEAIDRENPIHSMYTDEEWEKVRDRYTKARAHEIEQWRDRQNYEWAVLDPRDGKVARDFIEWLVGWKLQEHGKTFESSSLTPEEMIDLILVDARQFDMGR